MRVVAIPLALIDVGDRLRPVDAAWARLLAESIAAEGVRTPIEVGTASPDGRHALIAGAHRLEAAKLAGLKTVPCLVFDGDAVAAKLREIDENLLRRELSELDRAAFLAERKALWEQLHPDTRRGGYERKGINDKLVVSVGAFSEEAAATLGVSRRTIERAIRRYQDIAPDVRRRLAATEYADQGAQLDLLARFSQDDQRRIVAELLEATPPATSIRGAAIRAGLIREARDDAASEQLQKLLHAWKKAGRAARQSFLQHLRDSNALKDDAP